MILLCIREPTPISHVPTEIVFLAVNGYGNGASKLLRGLYERAVTLTYLIKFPEKVERFERFAIIPEYKPISLKLLRLRDGRRLPCAVDDRGRRLLRPVQAHHRNELRFRRRQPVRFLGFTR
jgi:hypothetical protein